jgi:LPPG:FO 2-phospho-L-lactate transferase
VNVVGLGGGIGASRFWSVLVPRIGAANITIVVNVADDLWIHGLRVCPDLDTTLYALSGRRDDERGWGQRGETWRAMDALRALGQDVWFNLGDLDLATHLYRTGRLRDGVGLAAVTASLATTMGVGAMVLPASDDEITTYVETADGERLHYEEFLVQRSADPALNSVDHVGLAAARPT